MCEEDDDDGGSFYLCDRCHVAFEYLLTVTRFRITGYDNLEKEGILDEYMCVPCLIVRLTEIAADRSDPWMQDRETTLDE